MIPLVLGSMLDIFLLYLLEEPLTGISLAFFHDWMFSIIDESSNSNF